MKRRRKKAPGCGSEGAKFRKRKKVLTAQFIADTYPYRRDLVVWYLQDGRLDELDEALDKADKWVAPIVKAYRKVCEAPETSDTARIQKIQSMKTRLRAEIASCYELAKTDPTYCGPSIIDTRAE